MSYEEEDTCGVVYLSTITIICNKYLPSNLGETIGSINCTSAAVLQCCHLSNEFVGDDRTKESNNFLKKTNKNNNFLIRGSP